jgi:hypothetical protein
MVKGVDTIGSNKGEVYQMRFCSNKHQYACIIAGDWLDSPVDKVRCLFGESCDLPRISDNNLMREFNGWRGGLGILEGQKNTPKLSRITCQAFAPRIGVLAHRKPGQGFGP